MSDTFDKLRRGLKATEDLDLPMDPEFFNRLHDKIMAQVEETVIEPMASMKIRQAKRFLKAHWRERIYPAGGTMALVFLMAFIVSQFVKLDSGRAPLAQKLNQSGEKVVAAVLESPDAIAQTLISSQAEADFFVDVASHSIENLSVSQFNKIMGESRTR